MEKITIYHTNDIHSQLSYWPRIARYLTQEKQRLMSKKETVYVFDDGDATDRVHPLTEATNGKAIAELLHDGSYDAVTIGNNEGIGNTKDQLNDLFSEARYEVVVSNLKDKETESRPDWAREVLLLKTKGQHTFALVGLTIPLPMSYDSLGWNVEDPFDVLDELVRIYRNKVDGFILLSHLGLPTDREIAERYPEVLVIMGGHTHHLLPEGEMIEGTLIAGAGKFGTHVGKITLEYDKGNQILMAAEVIDVRSQVDPVPDEHVDMNELYRIGNRMLEHEVLGELKQPLNKEQVAEPNLISLTLAAMTSLSDTTIGVVNTGLFLESLPKGLINRRQLHEALPHPMRVVEVSMDGRSLKRLLNQMEQQKEKLKMLPVKGYGFRGKIFGSLYFQGIKRIKEGIFINGKELDQNREYKLITVDYFLYVPFFPELQAQTSVRMISPDFLRTIVGNYIAHQISNSANERKESS
jgi:2',3'-cyclic-nucleotide 2'-phosphodiesterase (5'-nucleotidase family)